MRWLAHENFNYDAVRGLKRSNPHFDIVRAQDVGLTGIKDTLLLAWAAEQERIVLTHDVRTMPGYAYERIAQGLPLAGVVRVRRELPLGLVIEQVSLMDSCGEPGEWDGQVVFLPLR